MDKEGEVRDFVRNDRCAAGISRGMEVLAELVGVPINEFGARSLQVDSEPDPVSSTFVVFAKSEVIELLQKVDSIESVLAVYCLAMTNRMTDLVRKLGVQKDFVITGGQSNNIGIAKRVERLLDVEILKPGNLYPQIAGGSCAALYGKSLLERSRNK